MRRIIITFFIAALLVGCGPRQGKKQRGGDAAQKETTERAAVKTAKPFPYVTTPSYVTEPMQIVEYMAKHFWDKFDFSDTSYIGSDELEGAFANYLAVVLPMFDIDAPSARESIKGMLAKAESHPEMYAHVTELYDKYIYDPASPYLNEEAYIAVYESMVANPSLDEVYKLAPQERLRMAQKNRLGTKAIDFGYTTQSGRRGTLYAIDADYLIIFFYNLGCAVCKDVREAMSAYFEDPYFNRLLREGRIKVLAIYPDEQLEDWHKYLGDIPSQWTNAYDPEQKIRNNELYELRAIPSLYLLDKNKTVLLKDAPTADKVMETIAAKEEGRM